MTYWRVSGDSKTQQTSQSLPFGACTLPATRGPPSQLFLSFDMRKFIVLITDNRLPFPVFRRDLEKYIYQSERPQDDHSHSVLPPAQAPLKINRDHKGKEVVGLHTDGSSMSVISARDQPR